MMNNQVSYSNRANTNMHIINIIINLFFENRLVKACLKHSFFRNDSVKSFISLVPHLHYQRKDSSPICEFYTLENYKQGISDSCFPSEPNPVGHNKYQVLSIIGFLQRVDKLAYRLYKTIIEKRDTYPIASDMHLSFRAMVNIILA